MTAPPRNGKTQNSARVCGSAKKIGVLCSPNRRGVVRLFAAFWSLIEAFRAKDPPRRQPARQLPAVDFQLSLATESAESAYPEQPVAVRTGASIEHVVMLMKTQRAGAVIVCDAADKLVGVFTERDALRLMADKADLSAAIETAMSSEPVTVTATSSMASAIETMSAGGYRHLPLVSADDPTEAVGMIDVKGIVRYLVEHFPNTIYTLPPTSERSTPEREGA